jgi:hypothetical protein
MLLVVPQKMQMILKLMNFVIRMTMMLQAYGESSGLGMAVSALGSMTRSWDP